MTEAWDVATRLSEHYVSCMKINGVPLLPPVLTKECRTEMQYYKFLALEVEKRISLLKPLVDNPDSNEIATKDVPRGMSDFENIIRAVKESHEKCEDETQQKDNKTESSKEIEDGNKSIESDITVVDKSDSSHSLNSPKLVIDIDISINDLFKDKSNPPNLDDTGDDTPERDCDYVGSKYAGLEATNVESLQDNKDGLDRVTKENNYGSPKEVDIIVENYIATNHSVIKEIKKYPGHEISKLKEQTSIMGPCSLSSSKSFDDIHAELSSPPKLVRQRSYTILKPSPMLLAHLEVQSLNSGVEMSSISMSESCSNLSWHAKKRRSWDLESAKVKWSSMATELNKVKAPLKRIHVARPNARTPISYHSPTRAKSQASSTNDRYRRSSVPTTRAVTNQTNGTANNKSSISKTPSPYAPIKSATPPKKPVDLKPDMAKVSAPIQINRKNESPASPTQEFAAKLSMITADTTLNLTTPVKTNAALTPVKDDPSSCIRELYEKIQHQQLLRMASLIEKQKKEQLMLQQVFEDQNSLFYKQLKTICPKSPIEVKEAWSDKSSSKSHPVSLSQLINGSPNSSNNKKPPSLDTTLIDSKDCIYKTEEVLKKSRNILNNIKSNQKSKAKGCEITASSPIPIKSSIPRREDKNRSIIETPTIMPTVRTHQNSESSQSSHNEPILTDRTNDTLADLNFTLTSDDGLDFFPEVLTRDQNATYNIKCTERSRSPRSRRTISPSQNQNDKLTRSGSVDSNIENQVLKSYGNQSPRNQGHSERKSVRKLFADRQTSAQELLAASTIVAYAKGFLVRRLLRTERVQATVQTIRDALMCALQLHQDREGIRGADIDLHRRLIQQITAACYSLNDTFITSSPHERCALIAQDRERQRALTYKQMSSSGSYSTPRPPPPGGNKRLVKRKSDVMSHSHSGVIAGRTTRAPPATAMTQSNHEMYNGAEKYSQTSGKYLSATEEVHKRRPWR